MPGHRRRGSHGGGRGGERALREERNHKDDEAGGGLHWRLSAVDDVSGLKLLQQHNPGQLVSVRPDAHGHTLVHTCAIAGHERSLDFLLGAAALPVDTKDRDDKSPLHHAAYHNHPGCVDILLRYGADADAKAENRKFKSVMCRHHQQNACPFGDRCHFAHGPGELRGGPDGAKRRVTTPFESAIKGQIQAGKASQPALPADARSRFTAVCKALWEKSEEFPKVLHRVCKSAEALKMVSQFVIDCNLTKVEDWWQWTLLHHAAHVGDIESLRALIAADSELVNQVDSQGKTALHRAAQWGRGSCVRELLQKGAAPTVRNNFGMTPLQDALRVDADHEEVVQLLLQNSEVLADAQRSAAEGYVPLRRVLTQHAASISKLPKPQMYQAERDSLPDAQFPSLRLGQLTASASSASVAQPPAGSQFAEVSVDAELAVHTDAQSDTTFEERYADEFEQLDEDEAEAEPQSEPLATLGTAPQRRTPQPQSLQRRTPQPQDTSESRAGGAGAVLWGWGSAVSPGSLAQNHDSTEMSPPKPVPGEDDMLAGVSELWRPVALQTQKFAQPEQDYGPGTGTFLTDQGEGAAQAALPLNFGEPPQPGFSSMDQQSLPPLAANGAAATSRARERESSGECPTAGMPGGIWQALAPSGGGIEAGWAAAPQFQPAWDLSTPCVRADTRQHGSTQVGAPEWGGSGGDRPESRRSSRRGSRRRGPGLSPTRS